MKSHQCCKQGLTTYNRGEDNKSNLPTTVATATIVAITTPTTSARINKSSYYDGSGALQHYYTTEYNGSGQKIRNSSYDASGVPIGYSTYEY